MNEANKPKLPDLTFCPWCRGNPKMMETHKDHWHVQCESCGARRESSFHNQYIAADSWNSRTGEKSDARKELDEAWNEAQTCDDVNLERPLAKFIANLCADRDAHRDAKRNPAMLLPETITPELEDALSFLTYSTAPLARAYRDAGVAKDLPRNLEKEQAFILHKFIVFALKHGADWKDHFRKELEPVLNKAEENLAKLQETK